MTDSNRITQAPGRVVASAYNYSDDTLCMIHLLGPDDIYAAPSLSAAYEQAAKWQQAFDARTDKHELDPTFRAVVTEWEGTPEGHAENLEKYWSDFAFPATSTVPVPQAALPLLVPTEQTARLRDALSEALGETYVCSRVWSAWSHGTMRQDDFAPAAEDDCVLDNLVGAVASALAASPSAQTGESFPLPNIRTRQVLDKNGDIEVPGTIHELSAWTNAYQKLTRGAIGSREFWDEAVRYGRELASLPVDLSDAYRQGVYDERRQKNFQQRVQPWMLECFGEEISNDLTERNHRFLEESLELVQSTGCTQSEAHQLVDYVFGRPVGERTQEVGGVMVTLAALCLAAKLDMHAAGETELERIWTKVDVIRAKQAAKPKHSPLPQHVTSPESTSPSMVVPTEDESLIACMGDDAARLHDDEPETAETLRQAATRLEQLLALVNSPELRDFAQGVVLEAAHQQEKWGSQQDAGKTAFDWVFLVGHLTTRAAVNLQSGNIEKALHHCITTAAALGNWHSQILGLCDMRPGIDAPAFGPTVQAELNELRNSSQQLPE